MQIFQSSRLRPYILLGLLLAAAAILNIAAGAVLIPPQTALQILFHSLASRWLEAPAVGEWSQAFEVILLKIRLPHMVLAGLSGAALSGSGAAFQGLFRNPLADPYLIGVASGAGLGAVIVMAVREFTGSAGLGLPSLRPHPVHRKCRGRGILGVSGASSSGCSFL